MQQSEPLRERVVVLHSTYQNNTLNVQTNYILTIRRAISIRIYGTFCYKQIM